MEYIKKPVLISAMQFNGTIESANAIYGWSKGATSMCGVDGDIKLQIETLEGTMFATKGDYIIRGIKGEYYPCKPDIFEETYQPAILGEEEND